MSTSTTLNRPLTSATGAKWHIRPVDERQVLTIAQKLELPELIARALVARDVTWEQATRFLNPTLREFLPDPLHLKDMDKAANRLAEAVMKSQTIAVFGDYDVDGATSSALLKRYFRMLGLEPLVYIPDRIKEGYGPNTKALLELRQKGADVCITVDCGTLSFEPLEAATHAGLDMIVMDHHLSAENLPNAYAVVNPNRLDERSEHKHLAAVGVTFLLVVAINSVLKARGWFAKRAVPDLLQLLDLVALGTVCDVVPLKGVNRAFVTQGLRVLRQRGNIGLSALADVAGIDEQPGAYHLGFVLGPRINAGGRVGQADLGTRILSTENSDEAAAIAQQLHRYNAERQAIEIQVLEEAVAQLDNSNTEKPVLFAIGKAWHPGVIGIVASRLKDRYHRPTAVIAVEHGIGKASARSISGVDFGAAIVAANQAGLLIAGGGHAMAAGFTVEEGKIPALEVFLAERFQAGVDANAARTLSLDGYLSIAAMNAQLIEQLQQIGPFGVANPEPRFVIADAFVMKVDVIGNGHIRCIVGDGMAGGKGGSIKAMAFRSEQTPLGQALLSSKGKTLHLAGRMRLNQWQGLNKPELLLDDVAW